MIAVDLDRCTGCGQCVTVCPTGAIALRDGRVQIQPQMCIGCGRCIAACPKQALLSSAIEEAADARAAVPARVKTRVPAALPKGSAIMAGGVLWAVGRAVLPRLLDWAVAQFGQPTDARAAKANRGLPASGGLHGRRRRRLHGHSPSQNSG